MLPVYFDKQKKNLSWNQQCAFTVNITNIT